MATLMVYVVLVLEENLCQLSSLLCASPAAKPKHSRLGLSSYGHSQVRMLYGPSPDLHPYLSHLSTKCKIWAELTNKFKDILSWRNKRDAENTKSENETPGLSVF